MRLISLLLLLTAPAHADTMTLSDGHLYRDDVDLGALPWIEEPALLAPLDHDLFILHGDETCVLLLDVLHPPAEDLDGTGLVDDTDLNLLLSGEFEPDDLARMLAMFGRRLDLEVIDTRGLDSMYRNYDWIPVPFCDPVAAEFINGWLLVTTESGDIVEVDVVTGGVRYVGRMQPIPEPASLLLILVGLLWLQKRRRRR